MFGPDIGHHAFMLQSQNDKTKNGLYLVGFLAYRWDTISTVSNLFVSPINFLSGTFFSINALPENIKYILLYNPYYYLISYFRDSFYVKDDVNYYLNLIIFIFVFSLLLITAYVFHRGYKVIK